MASWHHIKGMSGLITDSDRGDSAKENKLGIYAVIHCLNAHNGIEFVQWRENEIPQLFQSIKLKISGARI